MLRYFTAALVFVFIACIGESFSESENKKEVAKGEINISPSKEKAPPVDTIFWCPHL